MDLKCHRPSLIYSRDQTLSLWSGSTVSKTLDQRANPREYQIVRTHKRKPLEYKIQHHPTTSSTLCRTPHLNNKQNKNTDPVISNQDYCRTQPCPSEEKQTNKQKVSTNSPHRKLTQTTGPSLGNGKSLSRVRLFENPWTVAYKAPPSMGFSRQEYWSGSPCPSPGDLPDPGIEPRSPPL